MRGGRKYTAGGGEGVWLGCPWDPDPDGLRPSGEHATDPARGHLGRVRGRVRVGERKGLGFEF